MDSWVGRFDGANSGRLGGQPRLNAKKSAGFELLESSRMADFGRLARKLLQLILAAVVCWNFAASVQAQRALTNLSFRGEVNGAASGAGMLAAYFTIEGRVEVGAGARGGAFPLAAGSEDAALIVNLPPGAYSAQVTDAGGGSTGGVAPVEVYELR